MREKAKEFFKEFLEKTSARIVQYPPYVKFLRLRDKLAEWIRIKILAFFSCIAPVLKILCTKTPESDKVTDASNQLSKVLHEDN